MIKAMQPEAGSPLFDVSKRPGPPVKCDGCGRFFDWEWWERRDHDPKFVRSRWFEPRVPCRACGVQAEDNAAHAALERRQAAAGIPSLYRAHRIGRRLVMDKSELPAEFRDRVIASDPPVLGMWHGNQTALQAITTWRPGRGWLWLQGAPGGGKSLFASVIATRTLQRGARRRVQLVEDGDPRFDSLERGGRNFRFVGGSGGRTVLMLSEDELHARAKLSWQGDRAPLAKISKVSVLFLDDLGTCGRDKDNSTKAVPRAVADTIERLLAYRYDRKLATVITSNEPIEHAETLWGKRVASRLAEMIPEGGTSMGGADWRRTWGSQ